MTLTDVSRLVFLYLVLYPFPMDRNLYSPISLNCSWKCSSGSEKFILKIEQYSAIGQRSEMQDYMTQFTTDEFFYCGVFDGHGGTEAASFASENLWPTLHKFITMKLQNQPKKDHVPSLIEEAIHDSFIKLNEDMYHVHRSWKPNVLCGNSGTNTAGTTASILLVFDGCAYVAHVGDSTVVMATDNTLFGNIGQAPLIAQTLTKCHKPDDEDEKRRVEDAGGLIVNDRKGRKRVAWSLIDSVSNKLDVFPFLDMTRALGDFWSYIPAKKKFAISPIPDISYFCLSPKLKFIILASDGLWNVFTPTEAMEFIRQLILGMKVGLLDSKIVSEAIVCRALELYKSKGHKADNVSVIIVYFS